MTADFNPEIRNRIRVAVAAFAYEMESDPVMSDAEFDALALKINPAVKTGNPVMDKFFAVQFDPSTGSWVHKHPNKKGLERIYNMLKRGKRVR